MSELHKSNMRANQTTSTVRVLGTEAGVDEPILRGPTKLLGTWECYLDKFRPMLQMLANHI